MKQSEKNSVSPAAASGITSKQFKESDENCSVDKNELLGSEEEELLQMTGDMEGSFDGQAQKEEDDNAEVELVDTRPKKLTGIDLIKENVKELHEVIAYMDYSFERAFTI